MFSLLAVSNAQSLKFHLAIEDLHLAQCKSYNFPYSIFHSIFHNPPYSKVLQ